MSMLNAAASYRREVRPTQRVPVLMPLVDVQVDAEGRLSVRLDREPYGSDSALRRNDLQRVLDTIAVDLDTPIRVEVQEADGSTFTDIVTPEPPDLRETKPIQHAANPDSAVTERRFHPYEDVAVAVVVAYQTAGQDGTAFLRLPPALREAQSGRIVLVGQQSGTIVVSTDRA